MARGAAQRGASNIARLTGAQRRCAASRGCAFERAFCQLIGSKSGGGRGNCSEQGGREAAHKGPCPLLSDNGREFRRDVTGPEAVRRQLHAGLDDVCSGRRPGGQEDKG